MLKKKIRIILESFNSTNLNESCKKFLLLKNNLTISYISGPISLPTKKRSYCVLRSPHVNKDSREQFEIRRYKKIIDIYSNSPEIKKILLNLLSLELFPGVFIKLI
ncbi:unnamed protein product [Choristocarpus tenellus]|uniref:30S ribosomal protein S10 n=1 Tax=Choristocarpus tenellus TaxID=116065 RepID=UPI002E7A7C78|nr:30S ribosomal protein S10 [Choristocarpus tenellus]WAM62305.1 30S ribosomal protein S10 [Choristocarpus tenellus]